MNKLLGFYELQDSGLPTIPWKEYKEGTSLEENLLWTVRMAVHKGDDLNLPRLVGVEAKEANEFAINMLKRYGKNGMVIYYPYFIAEKSGTLNVWREQIIVEAVMKDLWNLVTYQKCDVTIIKNKSHTQYIGNEYFLSQEEVNTIFSYVKDIKIFYRDELVEGKSILLEWSFAYNCGINKNTRGNKYLVFYEARTV